MSWRRKTKRYARSSAKKSAARQDTYFDLPPSPELPDIPERCPICEAEMESGGDSRNNSPSLDRLLPNLGYTLDNVWWICHDCNRKKADMNPADAYAMWDLIWEKIRERGLPLPPTRLRPNPNKEHNDV